jgi:hypothetical protein
MSDNTKTEWEEWNMKVTFTWTHVDEGPFPVDMPDEERAEKVKHDFQDNIWENFYHAYEGATVETQIETSEPEKYE